MFIVVYGVVCTFVLKKEKCNKTMYTAFLVVANTFIGATLSHPSPLCGLGQLRAPPLPSHWRGRNSWGLVRDPRVKPLVRTLVSAAGSWCGCEPLGFLSFVPRLVSFVGFVVCVMPASAVSSFIEEPSVVLLETLRVEDLHAIVDHYGLEPPKQARKAELLASVREGLVEKGVLVEGKEDVQDVERQTPPPSPGLSTDSVSATPGSIAAKLRVRLARLEGERKEREQARLFEFELEKRRIDAEVKVWIRQLELEAGVNSGPPPSQTLQFDMSKNIARSERRRWTLILAFLSASLPP